MTETLETSSRAQAARQCKINEFQLARDNLERNVEFASADAPVDFQPIMNHYLQCHESFQLASSNVDKTGLILKSLQAKEDIVSSVFLRYSEECMRRHYAEVTKVIQGIYSHFQSQSDTFRNWLQKMEQSIQSIDTTGTDVHTLQEADKKENNSQGANQKENYCSGSDKEALRSSDFGSLHAKSSKGVSDLRFLISLFQEASTIDDTFVRLLRKCHMDLTSRGPSIRNSTLSLCFTSLQKTVECMVNSIDERSSRMKEISKSLRRQKSIIKSNIVDVVNQHQAAYKRASSIHSNHHNISASYKKAVCHLETLSQKQEKVQDEERTTDRRQSFIVSMIHGRLPQKTMRARLVTANDTAERTQRALDHAAAAWKETSALYATQIESHLLALQNINATRINAVKWAFTTHCEHQTFYGQQMTEFLSTLASSIDQISLEEDISAFVRASGASIQRPPDAVIIATLDRDSLLKLDNDSFGLMDSETYCDRTAITGDPSSYRELTFADHSTEFSVESSHYEFFSR